MTTDLWPRCPRQAFDGVVTDRALSHVMATAELRAVDVMTSNPIVVATHESLGVAWEILARAGCGFLPVVRGGRVVGVIEERALVRLHATPQCGRPSTIAELSSPARTVGGATRLPELVARFAVDNAPALVVVDSDGGVLGVVTSATLVSKLDEALRHA